MVSLFLSYHSKDPMPSLSTVRRDEVDDIYVLPALPAAEEEDRTRSGLLFFCCHIVLLVSAAHG